MGTGMEAIIDVLPEGWREKARELNAFRGDCLKTPEDLLRVLLLWADLGTLKSYRTHDTIFLCGFPELCGIVLYRSSSDDSLTLSQKLGNWCFS